MYNPLLDAFIAVAEEGSFNKAATRLFMSPTAVMKKMNALETHLEIKLIERKSSGIELTPSGKLIYKDALFMKDYSQKAINAAKELDERYNSTFCVGTSLLNPAKPFIDLWYQINDSFPGWKLHLVPYDDKKSNILAEIQSIGTKYDFLIGVCDSKSWLAQMSFLKLGDYRKMIAVRRGHPLAKKKKVSMKDLEGYTLMMVTHGDSPINDFIRNDFESHYPEVHIEDVGHFYDLSTFNECAESDKILLTIECWKDVHPGLVTIPVDWEYTIPYGIMYPLDPSKAELKLINTVATKLLTK